MKYDSNSSWSGDTKVVTAEGNISFKDLVDKNIDEIHVLSHHLKIDDIIVTKMKNIRLTRKNVDTLKIYFNDDSGIFIECTPDHNIYLRNLKKTAAKDIKIGDILFGMNPEIKVSKIEHSDVKKDVYSGTVEESHTYFIYYDEVSAILSADVYD